MDKITHLWNISKYLTKFEGNAANYLRMCYIQRCKKESSELEQLPKTHFGPSMMCSHCGSLWSKNKARVRVDPGRACSKSVKQIIRATKYNSISRFRATLLKKSLKNQMNKIAIKCSVCSKRNVISCKKPEKLKPKEVVDETLSASTSQKKKKKKRKDKRAGLKINISSNRSPRVDKKEVVPVSNSTPVIRVKKKERELTPLQKVRKMNLSKLSKMLDESTGSNKSKSSISDFLNELY